MYMIFNTYTFFQCKFYEYDYTMEIFKKMNKLTNLLTSFHGSTQNILGMINI